MVGRYLHTAYRSDSERGELTVAHVKTATEAAIKARQERSKWRALRKSIARRMESFVQGFSLNATERYALRDLIEDSYKVGKEDGERSGQGYDGDLLNEVYEEGYNDGFIAGFIGDSTGPLVERIMPVYDDQSDHWLSAQRGAPDEYPDGLVKQIIEARNAE